MPKCTIRWRPSGGRGEYEFVPADSLAGAEIFLDLPWFKVRIPTETSGTISQGKPRLRKAEPNNRNKLHLVPLVMAAARLPDPAREDKGKKFVWPLENKGFLVSHMDFEVVERTGTKAILRPISAQILHSGVLIDLEERFKNIAEDAAAAAELGKHHPALAKAIAGHSAQVSKKINSAKLREAAAAAMVAQTNEFGSSNFAAVATISSLPATPLEDDISGKEGRVLTRLHSYRERDRTLVKKAKALFKTKFGYLFCECCGLRAEQFYGDRANDRIQAHHRTPMEQLLPDSVTKAEDLAMVCPNCHDIIHAKRPWLSVDALKADLLKRGKHYFD